MNTKGNCRTAAWASLIIAVCMAPLTAVAKPLKIGGTGAAIGTMQVLAEEYRQVDPSFALTIIAGLGSGGGIKAAAAGALDFALSGRPLKAQEQAEDLRAHDYGRTPFVIVTNKEGVENLSLLQLERIIGSSSPTWEDGAPVRLVLRPVTDADTELLGAFSPGVKQALADAHKRGGMVRAITDQESAEESERLPGSLGTSTVALLRSEKRALRVVNIDGVAPTPQNFASGVYPHGKTMIIVTKGPPNEATQKFLDFIASEKGRLVLVRLGHLVPSTH